VPEGPAASDSSITEAQLGRRPKVSTRSLGAAFVAMAAAGVAAPSIAVAHTTPSYRHEYFPNVAGSSGQEFKCNRAGASHMEGGPRRAASSAFFFSNYGDVKSVCSPHSASDGKACTSMRDNNRYSVLGASNCAGRAGEGTRSYYDGNSRISNPSWIRGAVWIQAGGGYRDHEMQGVSRRSSAFGGE
jgi:hypothetical protein